MQPSSAPCKPVQERHPVAGHHRVGEPVRVAEHERVEQPLQLLVVAEQHGIQGGGRHGQGHQAPPPVRDEGGRPVRRLGPPVVPDQHRVPVAAQGLVQGHRKPVQAQRQRARARLEQPEFKIVSLYRGHMQRNQDSHGQYATFPLAL
jgi:hypothetical protein